MRASPEWNARQRAEESSKRSLSLSSGFGSRRDRDCCRLPSSLESGKKSSDWRAVTRRLAHRVSDVSCRKLLCHPCQLLCRVGTFDLDFLKEGFCCFMCVPFVANGRMCGWLGFE